MNSFKKRFKSTSTKKLRTRLEREFNDFTNSYNEIFNQNFRDYVNVKYYEPYIGSDTSEETRELEHRPNKRPAYENNNLNNTQLLHSSKKTRAVSNSTDTAEETTHIEIDWFPDLYNTDSCDNLIESF
ncbi:unnamed protein product [Rhizophagus irregularis]|jgi:hypothetical protein|uniref:Uncharacterized protein n=1 Tax=Rhizophagus irregularis TaxID=588596 RepID=A0A2I1GP28_9GLOM|nr:hypothetical protein RhiirA4_422123 [Rhizophagus irregularis]PKY59401.1 hypothetical protein RhiirA4_482122 [Rhizophagus irregularis]CAB4408015.1 unnamed protein product [Rhizophagus irregularis]CAB4408550.1 unnamed protein product [Rhizophagus irregularis]